MEFVHQLSFSLYFQHNFQFFLLGNPQNAIYYKEKEPDAYCLWWIINRWHFTFRVKLIFLFFCHCLFLSLSFSSTVSVFLYLSLQLSQSFSNFLFNCLCLSLSFSYTVSYLSLPPFISVCPCLFLSVCLNHFSLFYFLYLLLSLIFLLHFSISQKIIHPLSVFFIILYSLIIQFSVWMTFLQNEG